MAVHVENIFAHMPVPAGQEQFITLLGNDYVTIERIVSHGYSSPSGRWYDQEEDEWVILLRGGATLEFEADECVELKPGDCLTIPRHVKHRVRGTHSNTVWLAVKVAVRP